MHSNLDPMPSADYANRFRLAELKSRIADCENMKPYEIAAQFGLRLADVPHYVRELKAQLDQMEGRVRR